MVKIVLPKEFLGFFRVGGEAYITRQSLAIDLDITSIDTLKGNTSLLTVNHTELGQVTLVTNMGII